MKIRYNKEKSIAGAFLGGAFLVIALISCDKKEENQLPDDYLAAYGSEVITKGEVLKALPGGLNPDDSARFVKAYVNNWIQTRLISHEATDYIDMDEIDRLAEEYRRDLILTAYRRIMFEQNGEAVPDDSVRAYYDAHKTEFILERPMVKGTYLKVPDDAKNLRNLKRLYKSDRAGDADRLEKEVLSSAIHYDYFRDKWVDWEQIETKIPEDFGPNPDAWLAKHHSYENSVGGFTYLLYITEVLPAGSPMPLEAARSQIVNRLLNINRPAYDAILYNDLLQRALSDKRLVLSPTLSR